MPLIRAFLFLQTPARIPWVFLVQSQVWFPCVESVL